MAVSNPWSITYGTREVGGSTDYQIHGPYIFDLSFDRLRLVFDVVVVGTSFADLHSKADALQDDLRKRDQSLEIDIDSTLWTYTFGTHILNTTAALTKSGQPETDKGFSRAYTCVIEGELPADGTVADLRELEVGVAYEPSRQKVVTMRGVYTADSSGTAVANYQAGFDSEASTLLTAIDSGATFELVEESYDQDRNVHTCLFSRQYVELLVNQSVASLDDTKIKDHRVTFTEIANHPGDSQEDKYRLRRVVGSYDCAIDIDVGTNLHTVFNDTVKPQIQTLFESNFTPQVFALEDKRVSYDEATKRLSASLQFIYQKGEGDEVVEVSSSVAYRELRTVDYTPTHDSGELTAEADPGWTILERVWTRTAMVIGEEYPKLRIAGPTQDGPAGPYGPSYRGSLQDGWNIISNTSQVTPQWIGDPDQDQIRVTVLTEAVVERYHEKPGTSARGGVGNRAPSPDGTIPSGRSNKHRSGPTFGNFPNSGPGPGFPQPSQG